MSKESSSSRRVNIRRSCSAPPRTSFTIYDHFKNISKTDQTRIDEEFIKEYKKRSFKKITDTTDFNSGKNMFSTGECVRFLRQIPLFNGKQEQGNNFVENSMENNTLPITLSPHPVHCPIMRCGHILGVTNMLSHYLADCCTEKSIKCKEIYKNNHVALVFNSNTLKMGQNCCLGILAYGGSANDPASRPALRGISMHNAHLPIQYNNWTNYLGILIMACRTNWATMLKNKQLETKLPQEDNPDHHLLMVWLACVETSRPIHGTITAFDKVMSSSSSSVVKVRTLRDPQDPSVFWHQDSNYLLLRQYDLDKLSNSGVDGIYLDININEYDQ